MDSGTGRHSAREVPELPVLTVSQLTQAIKLSLEATFPLVRVQGEISNFKRQSSGHLYFSLKDAGAQVSIVLFRGEAARLRFEPKEGDQVVLKGELQVYPPRGAYQLVGREMHLAGAGELLLKLEALKAKLKERGWFDPAHKKPLPRFPRRIGVVTSPTGAVIQDILHVLSRRSGGFHLILNPVKVQGPEAAAEIAKAIEQFNQYKLVDVMIVGRGGGSIEDLWSFNEEIVAEAIYRSEIPIISAVGHETDVTIADFVADVRAPTPSAAAEIVLAERAQQLQFLQQCHQRAAQAVVQRLRGHRQRLRDLVRQPVLSRPSSFLNVWVQRLDDLKQQIEQSMQNILQTRRTHLQLLDKQLYSVRPSTQIQNLSQKSLQYRQAIDYAVQALLGRCRQQLNVPALRQRLDQAWRRQQELRLDRLRRLTTSLAATDPKAVLKRGYSIILSEDEGLALSSVASLTPGKRLRLILSDGEGHAVVTD